MNKSAITKSYLLKIYKKEVNKFLDECDWVDTIGDWAMSNIIASIYQKKGIEIDGDKLLKLYKKKVKSLKLSTKQWQEQYADWNTGVPKIIDMVYEIIETMLKTEISPLIEFKKTAKNVHEISKDGIRMGSIYKVQEYYMSKPEYVSCVQVNGRYKNISAKKLSEIKEEIKKVI